MIDNWRYPYSNSRFALYAPTLDRFIFTHADDDMISFLCAVISSKIVTLPIKIDTASNFKDDFDNYVCYRYTMANLPSDNNFFAISKTINGIPYTYNGELYEYMGEDLSDGIRELQEFLFLACKIKNYFEFDRETKFLVYINDMNPELRKITNLDLRMLQRECYHIIYAERDINTAKNKIESLLDIKL